MPGLCCRMFLEVGQRCVGHCAACGTTPCVTFEGAIDGPGHDYSPGKDHKRNEAQRSAHDDEDKVFRKSRRG